MMDFEGIEKLKSIIQEKEQEIKELKDSLEKIHLKYKNELEEVQDYYEGILAVMPGHVYWLDRNNFFLGCNDLQAKDARLQSRKEIVGKTNYDLPWKDQAEELNRLNNLVMETGMPHTAEEYAVMANGLAIYLSQKTPIRDKNNNVIGVLAVSIDITEQKKMEAALRRAKEIAEVANHAKTAFIANMGHDIHTPLSGIVGLSVLLEEKLSDNEHKQYVHWINESGKQLLQLLRNILEVISDDKINESDVIEEVFDLRQSVQGIASLVYPRAKMKQLELILDIDETVPPKLITDGAKLHRVLLNLIGNAIKFTEKGSVTTKIKVLLDDHEYVQLQFSVSDTGIGIPPDLQTKVFERFFRVNPSYKGGYGGHGVGLHIAQSYVNLLGSEIKLASEPGKGSTFYFTLSLKVANRETINALENKTSPAMANSVDYSAKETETSSPNLLLVEANIVALRFLEALAIQIDCRFASATDAEHAFKLIRTMDFDLVLIDIELPGTTGDELAHRIREWEKATHKPAVPIVGLTTQEVMDSEAEAGSEMNAIITKPVRLPMMQDLLKKYVLKSKNNF